MTSPVDAGEQEPGTELDDTVRAAADPAVVGRWLAAELGDARWGECRIRRIGGGRSNLTFQVDSAAGSAVLRRPPLGAVAGGAHDMRREQRAMRALADTVVPVPAVLAASDESGPLGVPCYVMELVEGVVAADALPAGFATRPEERREVAFGLVDVLAWLHSVNPDEVGLADFGRPAGFLERQIRTWLRQLDTWRDGVEWPAITELAQLLAARIPQSGAPSIVHGDYRIDNVVLDPVEPGRVLAVLDWEMATLGDPLADLGLMLISWEHADETDEKWVAARVLPTPSGVPGFPSRAELAQRYAQTSGRSVAELPWYIAFGCFKMAVVLVGIVHRARTGAAPPDTAAGMEQGITPLALLGHHVLSTESY